MRTSTVVLFLVLFFALLSGCGKDGNIEGLDPSNPPTPPLPTTGSVISNKQFIGGAANVSGGGYNMAVGLSAVENKTLNGGGYVIRMGLPQEVTP